MKKIYVSAILIGLTSTVAFSQIQSVQKQRVHQIESLGEGNTAPTNTQPYNSKALGIDIWSDDFSTGANWTTNIETTASTTLPVPAGYGWNIGTSVSSTWSGFTSGINGSAGGFAEVYNGEYTSATVGTQSIGVTYTMTSSTLNIPTLPLNTGGEEAVTLSFKQFGALFNDEQVVEISVDGGLTFTQVYTNEGKTVYVGNNPTAIYTNPEIISVNLSPYTIGNASQVQLRFKWTSRNPGATTLGWWTTFGWFIDDVALSTLPTTDLNAKPYFWGVEGAISYNTYFKTPTTQVAPIEFNAIAINDGATDLTEVTLNVNVASGTFTGSSPAGLTIAPNSQDTATVSTMFTPPATVMSYPTTLSMTQTEVDDVPGNNLLPGFTFEVTENIYAADNGTAITNMYNAGLAYKVGAWFDIFNNQDLYGIDVKLNSGTVNEAIIRGVLYEVNVVSNAIEYTEVASSNYHDIVAADKIGFLTLELITPYALTAGQTYMVAAETDGDGGASNDVIIDAAQLTESFIGFQDETGAWFTGFTNGTNAPMVRMNFDEILGLDATEMVSGLSIYPNPATDNISVDFNLANASDVTIEVVDAAGKVAIAKTLTSQAAGQAKVSFETSALNSGIYFVNISTEAGKATQKFIKK